MKIYFDNAATTKAFGEVSDTVCRIMTDEYYNPSSPYSAAIQVEKKIDDTRNMLLKNLNQSGKIIFTSGGSESNNLAIKGAVSKLRSPKIITSETEHPSVKKTCIQTAGDFNCQLEILPVDNKGHVSKDAFLNACKDTDSAFISIMHVNNETGTINDIESLAKTAKDNIKNCVFHSDGVQAFMKVNSVSKNSLVDLYSVSAHKIHGPKGVGALYAKNLRLLNAVTLGGGQEESLRPGTHNTPGICGFGKAVEIMHDRHNEYIETLSSIKKKY